MKAINYKAYSLVLAAMLGMTACQSEEFTQELGNLEQDIVMTIDATLGNETRTTIIETSDATLKANWDEDDQLIVMGDDGNIYGTLDCTGGIGTTNGVFTGHLKDVPANLINFSFLYVGNKATASNANTDNSGDYVFNISEQQGTLNRLSDFDALKTRGKIECTRENGQIFNKKIVTLQRVNSFGHFTLSFPEGVKRNRETVTITSTVGSLYTKFNITKGNAFGNGIDHQSSQNISIITSESEATVSGYDGNELYVMFIPMTDSYSFDLNFSVVIGGKTYTGHLDKRTNGWTANEYVSAGFENGKTKGVVVEMTTEETVDQTRNPLKKWAESDLIRGGNEGVGRLGIFPSDESNYKANGYFFQFGRNISYKDYNEVNDYVDIDVADISNIRNYENVYDGLGYGYTNFWYDPNGILTKYPEDFLICGNSSLGNYNGDYYKDVKSHNWAARAKYQNYTYLNPCPTGYHIPTKAEWEQILPKGGYTYSTGSTTASTLNTPIYDVRTVNGVKVAFKWNREVISGSNYLKIQSLVVSSSVTDGSKANWTDKEVVTRYFKATGCIRPTYMYANLVYGYEYFALATPIGETKTQMGQTNTYTETIVLRDDSNLAGYYWVDDSTQPIVEFYFDPNNLQQKGSFIKMVNENIPYACKIRPVED